MHLGAKISFPYAFKTLKMAFLSSFFFRGETPNWGLLFYESNTGLTRSF
jgi:hypothetical protein